MQGVAARLSGEKRLQNPWINPSLWMRDGEKLQLFQALQDREEGVQATVVYPWAPFLHLHFQYQSLCDASWP